MFQERAQETPSDAFSSTHHAAREITAPLRRRGILVDENLNLKALRPLADRGIPLTHVREVGLCGHPDEEVFDHAISHQQLIATMDKDFSSFTRFDQSNSYGVLILPAPKKK